MRTQMTRNDNEKTMTILMELSRLIICEMSQHQVVFLREKNGVREFPIIIGLFEATILDRKIRKIASARPLTHDLFCQTVQLLNGKIENIQINQVERQTYFAQIQIKQDGKTILIDSRPSDALAISLCFNPPLPIFVTQEILNDAIQRQQHQPN